MSRILAVRPIISLALFLAMFLAISLPAPRATAQSSSECCRVPDAPADTFDPHANPVADLNQAIGLAEQTHRRILLDVGGQWCIWCKYLDQFFDSHPDLKALRDKNYVWVKVNFSRENENKQFLSQYPSIPGYPHFFILTTDGRFHHSQETSPLEDGFRSYSPERMKEFLEKWAPPQEIDTPLQAR